jgi:hypothetical protein
VAAQVTRETNPEPAGDQPRQGQASQREHVPHNGDRHAVPMGFARTSHGFRQAAEPGRDRGFRLSLQAWLALLALGLTLWLIVRHTSLIFEVSAVLFGAVLLNVAIHPLADRLASRQVPRWITVLAVYFIAAAVLVGLASSLRPSS